MMNFRELCMKRYSCRHYADRPVENEKIVSCLEAARLAPSSSNTQPWHFIVVTDDDIRSACANACAWRRLRINWWAGEASVMIVAVVRRLKAKRRFIEFLKRRRFHLYDMAIACEHLCLQATEEWLGSCILGWFNGRKLRKLLKIPFGKEVAAVITLGYPLRDTFPPKQRRDLKEIVSYNSFPTDTG